MNTKQTSTPLIKNIFPSHASSCSCDLFKELRAFKNKVEEERSGLHHHPYTINKNKVLAYKTAFFMLTALFIALTYHLYFSSFSWTCMILFGSGAKVRLIACSFGVLLSLASFVLGIFMNPETEIAYAVVKKSKNKVKSIFKKRLTSTTTVYNSNPRGCDAERVTLRHTYWDVLERIDDYKQETHLTIKRISISKKLDESAKESLYNQAILELQYKLDCLISLYEENRISSIY